MTPNPIDPATAPTTPTVPGAACRIAGRLAEFFERDQALVVALNDAHKRIVDATSLLTAGLPAGALQEIYGPGGPDAALSGQRPAVLAGDQPVAELEKAAAAIRHALHDYQETADSRRQLAFDVGEANAQLITAMTAAGFSEDEARDADIQSLAGGRYRSVSQDRA